MNTGEGARTEAEGSQRLKGASNKNKEICVRSSRHWGPAGVRVGLVRTPARGGKARSWKGQGRRAWKNPRGGVCEEARRCNEWGP